MAVSSYGASVVLQNNSGSAAASGAPTGSVFLFASGAAGSAKLFMNKEGSASDLELGSLQVAADAGSETIAAGETLTIAGGTGLDTALSSGTITFTMDLNELSAAAVDVSADSIAIIDANDSNGSKKEAIADVVTAVAGNGLAASAGVLAVDLNELSAASVNVANDSIAIIDADDSNGSKKEAISDLATAMAGVGIAASSGQFVLDISELSDVQVASGDKFLMLDSDASTEQLESVDDVATFMAGDGLAASSGVLAVQVGTNKGLALTSDKLEITGSAVAAEAVTVADDSFMFFDSDGSVKEESFADYATAIAGAGIGALNGALRLANASNGGLSINTSDINLDLSDLAAASVAVDADSIAIIDADDSSASKKESIADLMTAVAGDGLAASSGVLAVQVGTNKGLALTSDKLEITGSAVADGTIAVGTDTFMFFDSDGSVKEESIADLSAAQAGAGLAASSGVLAVANATNGGLTVNANDVAVNLNDLAAAAVSVANDSIAIIDADDSNGSKKESIADLVAGIASTGLDAASGQLSVDVSDFMDNGSNNRIITAKDADSMNAEANLTFDGSTLTLAGAMSGSGNVTLGGAIVFEPGLASAGIANTSGQAVFGISSGQVGAFQSDLTVAGGFTVGGGFGATGVSISNSGNIQANGSLELDSTALFKNTVTVGSDGGGSNGDFKVFGAAANEFMLYDASDNHLQFNDSDGNHILEVGHTTNGFALEVGSGMTSGDRGKIKAHAFVTYSDESLKKDIKVMDNALDTVMSLKGVEFSWKNSDKKDFGFIAQEVKSVLPQAVSTGHDGISGVDYSRLTSVLVEAVKAQQVQIEELKSLLKK